MPLLGNRWRRGGGHVSWSLLNMKKVLIPTASHLSKWLDVQQCLLSVTLLTVTVSNCISLSHLLSLNWPRQNLDVSLWFFFSFFTLFGSFPKILKEMNYSPSSWSHHSLIIVEKLENHKPQKSFQPTNKIHVTLKNIWHKICTQIVRLWNSLLKDVTDAKHVHGFRWTCTL